MAAPGPRQSGRRPRVDKLLARVPILRKIGRIDEAVLRCVAALKLAPTHPDALHALGLLRKDQGRLDEALDLLRRAVKSAPTRPDLKVSLGQCLTKARDLSEAERILREALASPDADTYGYADLANCLFRQGRREEARAVLTECIGQDPDNSRSHFGLGVLALEKFDSQAAIAHFETALRLDPDYAACLAPLIQAKMNLCDWAGIDGLNDRLRRAVDRGEIVLPFHYLTIEPDPRRQRINTERWWASYAPKLVPLRPIRDALNPDKRPLVLGYVSGDFHDHATSFLANELFALHDRDRFRVLGYSYGTRDDGTMRTRLMKAFDIFRDVQKLSSWDIAKQIEADGVDILIDLKGFTSQARAELLAMRPAPLLIHYLGYPGTLGGAVDALIADTYVVPDSLRPHYSELLALSDGCYQINDRQRRADPPPSRSEVGLPEEATVLGCFNSSYKITPPVFAAWMRLMTRFPQTVLWLLADDAVVRRNLRREAAARGVDPDRLVMAEFRPYPQHLARYSLVDLVLDTFPVTAHTTASDCLWAGCPLLTRTGESFVTRVAGSILTSVGMPELIAESLDDYEAKAVELLSQPDRLSATRAKLHRRIPDAPVFDALRTTRSLEGLYLLCWRHMAGKATADRPWPAA